MMLPLEAEGALQSPRGSSGFRAVASGELPQMAVVVSMAMGG